MHVEAVGYIGIEKWQKEIIDDLMIKHELCGMDCHESEIMVDTDPEFVEELRKKKFVSDEEAYILLEKCDVIKFYT